MNVEKKSEFDSLISDNELVLVDFWAPWCGPCRMVGPIIDELINEEQNGAAIVKVNVDEASEIANDYNIRSIPTILIFKNGKVVDRVSGSHPKQTYVDKLEENK